jgi:hypothetical protein
MRNSKQEVQATTESVPVIFGYVIFSKTTINPFERGKTFRHFDWSVEMHFFSTLF